MDIFDDSACITNTYANTVLKNIDKVFYKSYSQVFPWNN